MSVSDDGPSAYVSLHDRMEVRSALATPLTMRWYGARDEQTAGGGERARERKG
jgi:hypothetical protein